MRRRLFKDIIAACILMVLVGPMQAWAQSGEMQSLVDRLDRLERDIKTVNVQLSRGAGAKGDFDSVAVTPAPPQAVARMEIRITNLESELRLATGNAEEVIYQIGQINRRLEKLISDIDFRLSALEGTTPALAQGGAMGNDETPPDTPYLPPETTAAPSPPPVESGTLGVISESQLEAVQKSTDNGTKEGESPPQTASTSGVLPEGSPRDRYVFAFKLLRQAKYGEAEVALSEFLEKHGDDELAGNARYWLGETFYVRNNFRRAAQVFIESYRKNPKSAKAPDTLLKLGMSLAKLDKKKEACAAFSKLLKDFPAVTGNTAKLVAKERKNTDCK